jgi:hypothetical protein
MALHTCQHATTSWLTTWCLWWQDSHLHSQNIPKRYHWFEVHNLKDSTLHARQDQILQNLSWTARSWSDCLPCKLVGSSVASGFMLQKSNASPIRGRTDRPFWAHSDNSSQWGTSELLTLDAGNTVSPPCSTSVLPPPAHHNLVQILAYNWIAGVMQKMEEYHEDYKYKSIGLPHRRKVGIALHTWPNGMNMCHT